MSVALPEQLNFDRMMPLSGGYKQQMAVALPLTGASPYQLGSTFVINIPQYAADRVLNAFQYFNVHNLDGTSVLVWDHSVAV